MAMNLNVESISPGQRGFSVNFSKNGYLSMSNKMHLNGIWGNIFWIIEYENGLFYLLSGELDGSLIYLVP